MAGYNKEFTWDTYLMDVANIPAPYELFTSVCFFMFCKLFSSLNLHYYTMFRQKENMFIFEYIFITTG